MRWAVHPLKNYPGDLWSDWQSLAQLHHGGNPMLGASFARLLVEYFGGDLNIHVLCGDLEDRAVALALVEYSALGKWSIFHPSQSQAALIVCAPELEVDFKEMLAAFPGFCLRLDTFALDPREHGPFFAETPIVECKRGAHNVCVDVYGDFEGYWATRPRNLKKNLRRYRNRANEDFGQIDLIVSTRPTDVLEATDRYGLLESQGWKGTLGTALHPDNVQGKFYRALMVEMAKQAQSYVFELYASEKLVASRLAVMGEDILIILKTAFDEDYRKYAVGKLLLHRLLKHVFDHNLAKVVDFYTDANSYQLEWATTSRSMHHCSFYRSIGVRSIINCVTFLGRRISAFSRK